MQSTPSAHMHSYDSLDGDLSNLPQTWRAALADTPPAYRLALLKYVRALVEETNTPPGPGPGSLGHDIALEFTGLSKLQYSAFVPFHLIPEANEPAMIEIMERGGPAAVLTNLRAVQGAGRTALVLGDISNFAVFEREMDRLRRATPIGTFVAGPGPEMEPALRAYATKRGIPRAFVRASDVSRGTTWSSAPGAPLDSLIEELFDQHRPDLVLAFEPARLPSTLFTLDRARHLKLEISHIEVQRAS